ncbi:hypothetical protein J4558_16560 [Leptolyngbya sp. 15MV]|nr:hypothetical protein J4558_16560 [Leptolyngbya sp. 15MV]
MRAFSAKSISDLILTVHYTARDGGGAFRTMVAGGLAERMNATVLKAGRVGLFHAFDLRRDRPDAWHRLVTTGSADLTVGAQDLPYFTSGRIVTVTGARLLAEIAGAPASFAMTAAGAPVVLNPPGEAELAGLLGSNIAGVQFDAPVQLTVPSPDLIRDMVLVVNYAIA